MSAQSSSKDDNHNIQSTSSVFSKVLYVECCCYEDGKCGTYKRSYTTSDELAKTTDLNCDTKSHLVSMKVKTYQKIEKLGNIYKIILR